MDSYKADPKGYMRRYRAAHAARIKRLKQLWYKRNKAKVRAQTSAWQAMHPDIVREAKRRYRAKLSAIVAEAKRGKPCKDCGAVKRPQQMHFDHVRGIKRFSIGGPEAHYVSEAALRAEVGKCVIRCDSCHMKRHWRTRRGEK